MQIILSWFAIFANLYDQFKFWFKIVVMANQCNYQKIKIFSFSALRTRSKEFMSSDLYIVCFKYMAMVSYILLPDLVIYIPAGIQRVWNLTFLEKTPGKTRFISQAAMTKTVDRN